MSEYTENLGRQLTYKRERLRIETKCNALRDSLRRALPVEEEAAKLDGATILQTALALEQSLGELAEMDRRLGVIDGLIGR